MCQIDCKERLPEIGVDVVFWYDEYAHYGYYNGESWIYYDTGKVVTQPVIGWMYKD